MSRLYTPCRVKNSYHGKLFNAFFSQAGRRPFPAVSDQPEQPQPLPWELHPSLDEARLRAVARIVQTVCHDSAHDHQPAKGDSAWSLGCVRYARLCSRMRAAAEGDHQGWLGIGASHDLYLLLTIGSIPVRIYRGNTDEPAPARYALPHVQELHARQPVLDGMDAPSAMVDRSFRFMYEPDAAGELREIWFAQVDESGNVYNAWPIPLEPLAEVVSFRKAPVEPPALVVEPRQADAQQQSGA